MAYRIEYGIAGFLTGKFIGTARDYCLRFNGRDVGNAFETDDLNSAFRAKEQIEKDCPDWYPYKVVEY